MARPARILFAIIDLDGGAGVFCELLATGLKRFFPHELTLSLLTFRAVALAEENSPFSSVTSLNVRVSSDGGRVGEILKTLPALGRVIAAARPDVIFTIHTYPNLLLPLVAERVILSVHGHLSTLLGEARHHRAIETLCRWQYPRHLVVAPSEGVMRDLRENFGVERGIVIPHGVDQDRITALAHAEEFAAAEPRPYWIACGRLVEQKDYPMMLRAFAMARSRGVDRRLVIVGDGPERRGLESLAGELGVGEFVCFKGALANPFALMQWAEALVLSSRWEGFGLVLAEAMALGVPCVATDCPSGPAEILQEGHDGMLTPVGDAEALADRLVQLASSPEMRTKLAMRATLRAKEYTLERMATAYRALFLSHIEA